MIGQYRESYILIEKGGDLVVVDPHNADERVRYDRLPNGEGRSEKRSPLFPICLLYTSPSPRDRTRTRMPASA